MIEGHRFYRLLFVALNDDPHPPDQLIGAIEFARRTEATMSRFDAVAPLSRIQHQSVSHPGSSTSLMRRCWRDAMNCSDGPTCIERD